mmetsp:Transcript_6418/g.14097  ORF Transcript_6418/g.14097 Transcript_6418/m.14097 type:complete len:168 (+) Transcript_6418:35-538(+)
MRRPSLIGGMIGPTPTQAIRRSNLSKIGILLNSVSGLCIIAACYAVLTSEDDDDDSCWVLEPMLKLYVVLGFTEMLMTIAIILIGYSRMQTLSTCVGSLLLLFCLAATYFCMATVGRCDPFLHSTLVCIVSYYWMLQCCILQCVMEPEDLHAIVTGTSQPRVVATLP